MGSPSEVQFEIGRIGLIGGQPLVFELGWVVDGLSTMMFLVVTTVSLLVFIYAVGYMQGDVRVTFFFAALSLFAGSMLVLVAAPNLVQLIIGWEGVGLASYLLIGHYWEKKENSSAAMKAFYVNRVADIGLTIGAIILGVTVGTFRFTEILEAAEAGLGCPRGGGGGSRAADLLRGHGEERPVPAACLASRRHGRSHPGLGPHARRHDGHGRGLSDRPALSLL